MKTSSTYLKNHLVCFGSALLLLSAHMATAQEVTPVLLTINVANSSAVTITATGADPGTSVDNAELADGIDLLQFFQTAPPPANFDVTSSGLTTGNGSAGGEDYTYSLNDFYSGTLVDLNLYRYNSGAAETFSTGTAAFSGTLTMDLSSYADDLPTSGTGTIVTGYLGSGSPNTAIGYYQVVSVSAPEPSTWALLAAGISLLVLGRARLKAQRLEAAKI